MLARIQSATIVGVDAVPVDVEVDLSPGLPSFTTVGLPQGAVREGRDRVTAALGNSGFEFPLERVTVNLAPADVAKGGAAFDLPIALGVLVASGQLAGGPLAGALAVGELGLDGALRPVRGVLPTALAARAAGIGRLLLPAANAAEARVVPGIEVRAAATLAEVCAALAGRGPWASARPAPGPAAHVDVDLAEVRGQPAARRALEIAAAGMHHLLMVGPPGAGKTMLARRLPTILPPLTPDEAIETTRVHSVAGLVPGGHGLLACRPFRAPHHTVSDAGLIGGGAWPRPGEVSLAHEGVLFLDELPEFRRHVLEALRQPLEDGAVSVARARHRCTFPARVLLVAAMNPCPCGFAGHPGGRCRCPPGVAARYRGRVSGPLLDRFDLHLELPAVAYDELRAPPGEPSAGVRARVLTARDRQAGRCARRGVPWRPNARLGAADLLPDAPLDGRADRLLREAALRLHLSARGVHRVLRVARTIADLAGADELAVAHVAEALQYRRADEAATATGAQVSA